MEKPIQFEKQEIEFSGKGEIYSFTVVYEAAKGFEEFAPFVLALVKLDEGIVVTSQVTDVDFEEVYIGMKVEMVTRKLKNNGETGLIEYGYKFRPVLS